MKFLYTFYVWLLGGISYLIIFLLIILISPFFKPNQLFKLLQIWTRITLTLLLIRPKIIFEQEIDKSKAYIFMPNHVSMLDVLLAGAYWPIYINAIEAHTHFKWFIYGKVIKIFGQIPIDRTSVRASIKSFEIAKERIKMGRSIIVFPEGHRSKGGIMQPFKKLPFRFAKDAGVDIVPVAFVGLEKISPESSIWIKPAKFNIIFGKHITNSEIQHLDVDELKAKTRQEIERLIVQYPV
jgi:1-acyl-sn-glycerol-3-phosphate acyltransferase